MMKTLSDGQKERETEKEKEREREMGKIALYIQYILPERLMT